MVEELISEYIDLDATGRQTEAFLAQLKEIEAKYDKLNSIKLNLGDASGTKQVVTSMKDAAAATGELKTSIEGMSVSATEAAKSNATVAKSNAELVKSSRDANAAISDEAKANTVLKKSQADLTAELIRNKMERQAITSQRSELESKVTSGELQFPDEESFKSYQRTIVELTKAEEELKQEGLELSRAVRNIAKESINAEGSLNQLRAQLNLSVQLFDALGEADRNSDVGKELTANIKELTKEISAQEQSTGRFQRNVGNYSGAVKVLEKSLDSVNKKLKQNQSENKLSAAAVEMLQKEQALLETFLERQTAAFTNSAQEIKENTKQLELLAAAGLESSNAYRELFAATSELKDNAADLKTALNNAAPDDVAINAASEAARGLVGVYGLAQSATAIFGEENEAFAETMVKLQAAETALQSIEAIRAVFKKESAVLQAKEIILTRATIIAKNIETATESKNIVVKYAAVAAQKALNLAMASAGGPILILIGTLALLLVTLTAFAAQAKNVVKSQEDMAKSYLDYADTIEKTRTTISQMNAEELAGLRRRFASAKELREKALANEINDLRLLEKANTDYETHRYASQKRMFALEAQLNAGEDDEDIQKEYDTLKAADDKFIADKAEATAKQSAINVQRIDNERTTTEEIIKAKQEEIDIYKTSLTTSSKYFEDLAGNEEKSYDDRIEAARRFQAFQIELIEQEAKKQRLTPGQTPSELKTIESNRNAALIEARKNSSKQIEALVKEENARIFTAQVEMAKIELEQRAQVNAEIAANENIEIDKRSDALAAEMQQRIKLITSGLQAEIAARKNILPEERAALEKKANVDILNLRSAFLVQLTELNNKALLSDAANNQSITNRRRDELLAQLADEYNARLITQEEYEDKKFQIEKRYSTQSLQLLISDTEKEIEVSTLSFEAKKALLEKLAGYKRQLSEKGKADTDAENEEEYQDRVKFVNDFAALSGRVADTISELASIGSEKELAGIESAINALEKKKQKEIEVANASITNEQDRAAAITTIEARATAEKEALERRRRQIEAQRAKTERYITIGRIIADTAAAVVAALGTKPYSPINIALAAATGALGAAQLAKVLATPLPQFKTGKNEHNKFEGYGIVGDGGKQEMIKRADGTIEITPDKPTITYIKRDDIILPDADQAMRDLAKVSIKPVPRNPVSIQSNTDMISAFKKGNKELVNAIKNKKELEIKGSHAAVIAIHKHAQERWNYINENTNF